MSTSSERTHFRRHLRRTQTEAERKVWYRLRDRRLNGFKFLRQESIGPYVADFCCREAKLIIEIDGSQHAESSHDRVRDAWLDERGYRMLRFWNSDVMTNMVPVLETIMSALYPSPRTRGEDRDDLVVGAVSPKGESEGISKDEDLPDPHPHPRSGFASAPCMDDEVHAGLSPQAGRGGARS